jgi:hypothetical protein
MSVPTRPIQKVAKKYYFAPDVIELIETEANRTGYPRNVILEIMVREKLGHPPVEEAAAVEASTERPRRRTHKIDIFSN